MSNYNQVTIRPLCASLQHDVDIFGKMDPYCLVTLGTQQWKSEISKSGGKTPCWNDEVVFVVQQGVDLLRVALFDDKLIGPDKLIAEGVIPMDKLLNFSSPFEEKIPLTYKAKPCGYIQLRFTFGHQQQMMNQNLIGQTYQNQNFQQQQVPFQQQQNYQQQQQVPLQQNLSGQQLQGQQLTSQSIPYQQQNVPIAQNQIPQQGVVGQAGYLHHQHHHNLNKQ
jgi:hypothetical protein